MSCTIAISGAPKDIWIIRNAIFRWLNRIICTRHPDDAELIEHMRKAEYLGGISIDKVYNENPLLANRIIDKLFIISEEISNGKHLLQDDNNKPWPELQKQMEESFSELITILSRWNRT